MHKKRKKKDRRYRKAIDVLTDGACFDECLRISRHLAHKSFDALWIHGRMTRNGAYKWLSWKLGIEPRNCHISMFGITECRRVIAICKLFGPSSPASPPSTNDTKE